MDEFTPMEPAEILEVDKPVRHPPEETGYYGTVPAPKKRRHVGLVVFLCVLLLAVGGIFVLVNFYEIRIERSDDGYSVIVQRRGSRSATSEKSEADIPDFRLENTQTSDTASEPLSLQEIYQTVSPGVVAVSADGTQSIGSGVVISEDGYIVTSYHVVDGGTSVEVQLLDGDTYRAGVVASDEVSDLALLKVDATGLTPVEFGDSDEVQVGDAVVAIGNPLGIELSGTMTNGIISAINRNLDLNGSKMTLLQTNAALNNGNSGGPLINSYGQVIGINTAKINANYSTASVEGIGFAIPSNTVCSIVDELLTSGYVSGRATLRLSVADMNEVQRVYLQLPKGVYVMEVTPNSNAYFAGIRYGDILVSIDGAEIDSTDVYTNKLSEYSAGDTIQVVIYRNGALWTADILLEEQVG